MKKIEEFLWYYFYEIYMLGYDVSYEICRDDDIAHDAAIDAVLGCWSECPELSAGSHEESLRKVRHCICKAARLIARKFRPRRISRVISRTAGNEVEALGCPVDEIAENDDTGRVIREEVERLPKEDRFLIVGRFYEQKNCRDLATELGLAQVEVSRQLHRACMKLRGTLKPRLGITENSRDLSCQCCIEQWLDRVPAKPPYRLCGAQQSGIARIERCHRFFRMLIYE